MKWARSKASGCVAAVLLACSYTVAWADDASPFDPQQHEGSQQLVDELTAQGIPRQWLTDALNQANFSQSVLDAMEGAAERRLRWYEYRDIFLTQQRIEEGAEFISEYEDAFIRAEDVYGVPPEIIAAIIGVETYYGKHKGSHLVLDSLATLAFNHPVRGSFFRGELAAFLKIAHEQGVEVDELYGSYAGAMGYPQFIPTSYQAYAVDFDGDGKRDLWENPVDAIGSVANYFAVHGWQRDGAIYHEADGPDSAPETLPINQTSKPEVTVSEAIEAGIEPQNALDSELLVVPLRLELADDSIQYRLGEYNFYVITRYNHSHLYAMAVTELSEAIARQVEG
ncbi:MAG: lytic murein transglycosylase B [Gammaproteobacteria bacterium]|uniref:lytic murein transglycosylase B n=1 Tax=Vreelandella venusta TaxID=44935 RepID=UPI0029B4B097|nr:lytic murein transglycosylase B [Gammaproteobacteria bacterium]MDX1713223.1 lytic murein transglycosylase B [Halomonas venusta]